ncbi:hypothetical protein RclHR1_16540002 [Rhizophagus clarus]|uniref:Uncharacterized protein n=1 Tax=Rhizophagus clarus TaxID=94130 RepID=A0A2Z6QHV4_9GLOM|nr:hypothetical protein RclHR1_16540002 [Rhizophagus clarus]
MTIKSNSLTTRSSSKFSNRSAVLCISPKLINDFVPFMLNINHLKHFFQEQRRNRSHSDLSSNRYCRSQQ